ncbi:hypothetical protein B0G76_4909 [Paraburkholderia sp. BL23I1N1]|nr:hypothetical protein B0G76_4909 [Paraburkholderia sp. BL23I1N1]
MDGRLSGRQTRSAVHYTGPVPGDANSVFSEPPKTRSGKVEADRLHGQGRAAVCGARSAPRALVLPMAALRALGSRSRLYELHFASSFR